MALLPVESSTDEAQPQRPQQQILLQRQQQQQMPPQLLPEVPVEQGRLLRRQRLYKCKDDDVVGISALPAHMLLSREPLVCPRFCQQNSLIENQCINILCV